jgi:hypothetical protein
METIKCEHCGKERPLCEIIAVQIEDEQEAWCIFCFEDEMHGKEMMLPKILKGVIQW